MTRPWYSSKLQQIKDSRIVMIFDECHRSHFGDSHKNIVKFFNNLQIFGFTGTPIFAENSTDKHTTKEIFGECLHKYLIKDAIADENVLGFLVEYYHGNSKVNNGNENRMREIAKFILNNYNKSTYDGEFDALFAVQSVPMLVQYYKIFKELNPKIRIGAIFTYASNDSQDDETTGMSSGSFVSDRIAGADDMEDIIDDYNKIYGTSFSLQNFRAYYDDVNLRLKKKKPDMLSLDLCLVVGMFLTGFDSKKLNTLYIDKNLEYHGLLQAFSRTNRVLNERKRFGKIVCFRDLKSNVDAAIKLFSEGGDENVLHESFEEIKKEYVELTKEFLTHYPDSRVVDYLQSEEDKRNFILAFRDIIRKHAEIQIYEDFNEEDPDFPMDEQLYMDFRSKYLDIHDTFIDSKMVNDSSSTNDGSDAEQTLDDIDFCLELLHSDIINVAYILSLIADLDPNAEDYPEKRQEILDTMIKDAELRSKTQLIDGFILQTVDNDKDGFMRDKKADGSIDLEERLNQYIRQEKGRAIESIAQEEEIPVDVINKYVSEYDYVHKEQTEIIQEALKGKKLGLVARRRTLNRIVDRLRNLIKTFSWD